MHDSHAIKPTSVSLYTPRLAKLCLLRLKLESNLEIRHTFQPEHLDDRNAFLPSEYLCPFAQPSRIGASL